MKIDSIQFKFLTTIISAMIAITFFVGGLCIYEVDTFVQLQTENLLDVTSKKESVQVNNIFKDMEKSVNIMGSYTLDYFSSKEEIKNRDKQNELIQYAEKMFEDVAQYTSGAIAYYLRFAPEISDSTTGLFYSKVNGQDEYIRFEPTDLSLYSKDDIEHVGWYWQPYEAEKPVWMKPYYNENNNILMISYVVPLYYDDLFVGIVGMDFEYQVLTDKVDEIKIYENGFAYLELDGLIIHNDDIHTSKHPSDIRNGYLLVSEELVNGMTLVLAASYDDMKQLRYDISLKIIITTLILTTLFSLIVIFMVKRIVKPLKELTMASEKLANGDYDVEIVNSDTYEIKLLSKAFENMTMHLREHEELQYLLAYRDSMTGLRNTTAYKAWINDFNKEIQNGNNNFGLIVFDINYLKETNDKYGHDTGNKLIIEAAKIISDAFKRSPVFRIGGDEFLAVLQKSELENYEELLIKFDIECSKTYIENNPISIARGFAKYEIGKDTEFVDVFNRADDEMYKNKRKMKSLQG